MFQLYGGNGKVKFGGENAANYENSEFDRLFNLMKNRENDSQRQQLIDAMVNIVRHDAPGSGALILKSLYCPKVGSPMLSLML